MRELRQITVLGLGLLGGSITLAVSRTFAGVKTVGYSHRSVTRRKARELAVATEIADDIRASVSDADLVILATPIGTFEKIFGEISDVLPEGCIVTDVGSTKALPHQWAAKKLPETVHYVGSHPIAGSEQSGVEFARDDLFERSICILTTTNKTNRQAVRTLKRFWSKLGCSVKLMSPAEHDRILANVSHLPHITAAALINASNVKELPFSGKGFMDMSRIASSPTDIWADVLVTNAKNVTRSIDKITAELGKLKKAIKSGDKKQIEKLLKTARSKRSALIKYKIRKKEIIS
ncbi:MAG: prephenate dehydrogenase/arogenate dehydrogenase family protein [Phycisphaerae bacterium]|nr:prephenate dehydrogenase/arogenate dehydrogenase family protein [Phycisphaerae bacterium]MDD5380940.1 prephenate dehydrogenase/arogenate dehydrogenase family protein [Phycisphaerae bacterium]